MKSAVLDLRPEELLEHAAWMRGLARRLVLEADHVDDVVQEAWAAALERRGAASEERGGLRAWLGAVVRNRALLRRRSDGRRAGREERASKDERLPSTAELVERADLQRLVVERVGTLPAKYREVVLLRFFEDLKPAAIARRLGVPVETVRTRLSRAYDLLRDDLDRLHDGDRTAWSLALLPLATLDQTAKGAAGGLSVLKTSSLGAWIVLHPLKSFALVLVVAVASLGWTLREPALPDLRIQGSPQDAVAAARVPHRTSGEPQPREAGRRGEATKDAQKSEELPVRGRVVDLAGRPIPGATVSYVAGPIRLRRILDAQRSGTRYEQGSWSARRLGITDTDGRFAGPDLTHLDDVWLGCEHDDYVALRALTALPAAAGAPPAELAMAPLRDAHVTVEVFDREGERVPRFIVTTRAVFDRPEAERKPLKIERLEVLDGSAELETRFAESFPLEVDVNCVGQAREARLVALRRGERRTVRFDLDLDAPEREDGAVLAFGRVVDDETGAPIGGAYVRAHPYEGESSHDGHAQARYGLSERSVQTRFDGTFRVATGGTDPRARVSAHHPSYLHEERTALFDGTNAAVLRLRRKGSLVVRVVDRDGAPLAGAYLLRHHRGEDDWTGRLIGVDQRRGITGPDGSFVFRHLPPGRHYAFVVPTLGAPDESAIARGSVVMQSTEDCEITIRLDPPDRTHVTGRVTHELPDAPALIPMFLPYGSGEAGWVHARPVANGRPDYDAGGLAHGTYLVVLTPPTDDDEGPYAFVPEVEIDGLAEQRLDFELPTGTLEGVVHGAVPPGTQVAVVPVLPEGFASEFLSAIARVVAVPLDGNGRFRVEHLSDGPHRVLLRANDKPVAAREVEITGATQLGPWTLD